jgi:hypothetical protein
MLQQLNKEPNPYLHIYLKVCIYINRFMLLHIHPSINGLQTTLIFANRYYQIHISWPLDAIAGIWMDWSDIVLSYVMHRVKRWMVTKESIQNAIVHAFCAFENEEQDSPIGNSPIQ